jgi:aminopeptidase N
MTHVTASAQNVPAIIEKGVSQKLADYRYGALKNIHYDLSFQMPALRSNSILASAVLRFDLLKNSIPLQIDFKESADHLSSIIVNGKKIQTIFREEHIIIDPKYLKKGENSIHIKFVAGELSLNRNNDYLYTLLVPDRARTLFPCFDQPNLKAKFRLLLSVPAEWKVLSNAPLKDIHDSAGTTTYAFHESEVFSTYLFSFVAGRFKLTEKQTGNRLMHFYYRETDSSKIRLSVDTVFNIHSKAIAFLEQYTKIQFPFQKLDFVAIPDFQYGGMEHVGAIDYKASSLFLDSGATKDQLNARSNLIAHETSHMWFGDLVTMQWFNDVWMKEVFANFMADKITQGDQTDNSYELKFLLTHYPRAYAVDRTEGANPIRQSLPNLNQAGSLYGAIIYDKAPVMMRQLERLMGADAFRDGIREYLGKYSYSNATWPDLISILDKKTPENLQAWNKVWVNTAGRPVIDYEVEENEGVISKFVIRQKGERSINYLLPQFFKIGLVYADHVEQLEVNMDKVQVELMQAKGKRKPLYILFNSSGEGYGLFPVDKETDNIAMLTDPVMRASTCINLYENMLSGKTIQPKELLFLALDLLALEKDELIASLLAGYVGDIYWRLITKEQRNNIAQNLEGTVWNIMQKDSTPGKKKILFRCFQNISTTKPALDSIYKIWKTQQPPVGIKLSEDEYISMALNLALKEYPDESIMNTQQNRITNSDRKQRLEFISPAVSQDEKIRDAFFASLKEVPVRKKEAWVIDALAYLHHPLRSSTSEKYLKQTLDMLEEIQRTNDIFFPGSWLSASFGSYQTKEAGDIVRNFLRVHPDYNPQLKMKILQAADPLFRAEKLLNNQ